MRMSCNGCRVLRKGCAQDCTIRPCLQWIETADSQANVTLFLAKFYGRAGLLNLINAAEHHHRPFIFRSLLYEACGRIVNPIYGSVGLLWSGNWQLCQTAVEAVLKGAPVIQIPPETTDETANPIPMPLLKAFDIRHVSRDHKTQQVDLHKVKVANSTRTRFKRSSKRHVINNHDNSGNYKPPIFDVHGNDRRWMNLYETNNSTAIRSGQPIQTTTEDSKEDNVKLELTIGRCPISPPTDAVSHSTTVDRCIELSMSDYKRF